jgi:hypothetical protein
MNHTQIIIVYDFKDIWKATCVELFHVFPQYLIMSVLQPI